MRSLDLRQDFGTRDSIANWDDVAGYCEGTRGGAREDRCGLIAPRRDNIVGMSHGGRRRDQDGQRQTVQLNILAGHHDAGHTDDFALVKYLRRPVNLKPVDRRRQRPRACHTTASNTFLVTGQATTSATPNDRAASTSASKQPDPRLTRGPAVEWEGKEMNTVFDRGFACRAAAAAAAAKPGPRSPTSARPVSRALCRASSAYTAMRPTSVCARGGAGTTASSWDCLPSP